MKIAVPVANKVLCTHFGHCEIFSFFEIDEENKTIIKREDVTPPAHTPGSIPKWIAEQKANLLLAGGIGQMAQNILTQNGVKVIFGLNESDPEQAVLDYLNNKLSTDSNACNH